MHQAIRMLKKIPRGKVVSYGELARILKTSPRAIGKVMAENPDQLHYPCYKVVSARGNLCGYSGRGGLEGKRKMLEKEGVVVDGGKVAQKYFYTFK